MHKIARKEKKLNFRNVDFYSSEVINKTIKCTVKPDLAVLNKIKSFSKKQNKQLYFYFFNPWLVKSVGCTCRSSSYKLWIGLRLV